MSLTEHHMLTLTASELSSITGRSQPAAQVRWLRTHGWIHEIGSDGLPKVASAYFQRRMVKGEDHQPILH